MVLVLQLFIALKSRLEIIEASLRISYQKKDYRKKAICGIKKCFPVLKRYEHIPPCKKLKREFI
ncbi:MAG: hypothetical protein C0197_03625 [Caldimicrobium thiodismutans]|jgi:hypothetical protein|uniref:Uncharacterized protein n=1 Tax=Caldimicrobium thiodismutans TaxID=1653476 RepID=A0A2N7PJQ5_9BACT|nr:MAG: hypothetical protein C0197_03625 [Caldimicrobium thiodismutans]